MSLLPTLIVILLILIGITIAAINYFEKNSGITVTIPEQVQVSNDPDLANFTSFLQQCTYDVDLFDLIVYALDKNMTPVAKLHRMQLNQLSIDTTFATKIILWLQTSKDREEFYRYLSGVTEYMRLNKVRGYEEFRLAYLNKNCDTFAGLLVASADKLTPNVVAKAFTVLPLDPNLWSLVYFCGMLNMQLIAAAIEELPAVCLAPAKQKKQSKAARVTHCSHCGGPCKESEKYCSYCTSLLVTA